MSLRDSSPAALLKLHAALIFRPDVLFRLVEQWGTADAVLGLTAHELARDGAQSLEVASRLLSVAEAFDARRESEELARVGGRIVVYGGEGYPALLQSAPDAPALLYVRGALEPAGACLAVVGTRRPTPYGRRAAKRLVGDAARAGLTIVSGMARGVDTIAHKAALDAGARTIAVLGSGLLRPYPPENVPLMEAIARQGAVASELPLEAEPHKEHFPRRNRIVSGLSLGALVVEGDLRSGALITAKASLEQGRDVFAVPGPLDSEMSRGPHLLIKHGAKLVEEIEDVLDELPLPRRPRSGPSAPVQGELVSGEEEKILEAIGEGERSVDEVVRSLGWDVARVNRILFDMELREVVAQGPGQRYARK